MVNQHAGRRGTLKEIRIFLSTLHAATTFLLFKLAEEILFKNVFEN